MKLPSLKGRNRLETLERISVALIFLGAFMLSFGIGLTILAPKGIFAILVMVGAATSFFFTVVLIFTWLVKEFKGE